jgi:tetratricopeptide (TPR) repeat protein
VDGRYAGAVTDDDVSDEGAALPRNPTLREVVPATPSDRTAMIDLEALEAKRAARRADEDARAAEEAAEDEKTPPPEEALARDPEATGTMARGKRKRRGEAGARLVRNERPRDDVDDGSDGDAVGDDGGAADEATEREELRGTRSGMARRDGTRPGVVATDGTRSRLARRDGTRTGMTRARPAPAKPARQPLSPLAAASVVVIAVVAVIVVVFVAMRATGVLTINTVPHGATVTLDGEPVGASPLQKRVRTGSHVIELALEGFEPFREVVDVPSAGLSFLQPLKALPPPPPPPPTNAEIAADLAGQARRLLDAGDLDGAIGKVDEIERLVPDHAPSAAIRQAVRTAQGAREDARRRDAAAAARDAGLARARQKAEEGRRLYEQGKLGPARTTLYESLKIDARNPEPHRTLAKIFNRDGDLEKVRYHLERFLELGGNDADFKVREWLKAHPK